MSRLVDNPKYLAAEEIVMVLRAAGHQAYFAGGCVRDFLFNRTPADYDVATSATPQEVMHIFPDTYAVGAQFGVVLVPIPKETNQAIGAHEADELDPVTVDDSALVSEAAKAHAIEVATFRTDVSYSDGRHPDAVRFSSTSEGTPGHRRSFAGFWAAAQEAGRSRIYGGIHYEFDNSAGLAMGRDIANHVARNFFQPRSRPSVGEKVEPGDVMPPADK